MIANTRNRNSAMHRKQQGIVLIVGLVMLISLTLIGVTAMKSTTMDERIAANTQFKVIAFQTAESVLSDAADWDAANACYLSACVDDDAVFSDGTGPTRDYSPPGWVGPPIEGKGEMTYLGVIPIAGFSVGGPILTPAVRFTGCASDSLNPAPNPPPCSSQDSKLASTNARAVHNMGVALVGVAP